MFAMKLFFELVVTKIISGWIFKEDIFYIYNIIKYTGPVL